MPIGAAGAAIITGAATIAASGANAYAQGKMNKRALNYNREAYARQRTDALSDYETQNRYNSPEEQMKRFRDAGLNPNLIYGQQNEGATVRSSDMQSWNPRAPSFDIQPGNIVSQYFDTRLREAQIDQARASITVMQQDALQKAQQTANLSTQNAMGEFNLMQSKRLAETQVQAAQANLDNVRQQTESSKTTQSIALQENERRAALTSQSLQEGIQRILQIRAQTANTYEERKRIQSSIENLNTDTDLKKEDLELRKKGINPQDPVWLRMLGQYLEKYIQPKSPSTGKPFGAFEKF